MKQSNKQIFVAFFLLAISGLTVCSTVAQENDFGFGQQNQDPTQTNDPLQDPLSNPLGGFGAQNQEARADFESKFMVVKGQRKGTLFVTGRPDPFSHSHVYSQRTDLEFQTPTVFKVAKSDQFKLLGKFVPDRKPEFVSKQVGKDTWETEEFAEDVTWAAPIQFSADVDIEKLEIKTQVEGQVCNDAGCLPYVDLFVTAKFSGYLEAGPYRAKAPESDKVEWTGKVSSATVKPGDKFTVTFAANVDPGWHIYGTQLVKGQKTYSPTVISFSQSKEWTASKAKASVEPKEVETAKLIQYHHEGQVAFSVEFTVPEEAESGLNLIQGKLGYQTCDENGVCKMPSAADFRFEITVGTETDEAEQAIILSKSKSKYSSVLEIVQKLDKERGKKAKEPFVLSTFLWYCGVSFLAGLILNVMPCVLPVIGLKMMSFIEQAGENRGRIFALNIAFSLGLMSVFWLLGFLVVIMDFGWGDLLNKGLTGVIIASGVVFAFGLSMMGVWEIPIPGFASSTHASKMAEKEGLGGAFIKGILTTVLATPCVGPMLIPAMTFAVSQSQFVGFAIFTVLGIGMAFPFLLVAVFPGAIKLLPKPGLWMDTFKQVMGFVLIGTVLFLLSTFAKPSETNTPYILPVLFMLLMIGIGCWWIGRTSIAAEFSDKFKAYVVGVAIIGGGTWGGFYVLGPSDYELEWQPYSNTLLANLREEGKPIFIDFTGPG